LLFRLTRDAWGSANQHPEHWLAWSLPGLFGRQQSALAVPINQRLVEPDGEFDDAKFNSSING